MSPWPGSGVYHGAGGGVGCSVLGKAARELPGLPLPAVIPYRTGENFVKWIAGLAQYFVAVSVPDAGRHTGNCSLTVPFPS